MPYSHEVTVYMPHSNMVSSLICFDAKVSVLLRSCIARFLAWPKWYFLYFWHCDIIAWHWLPFPHLVSEVPATPVSSPTGQAFCFPDLVSYAVNENPLVFSFYFSYFYQGWISTIRNLMIFSKALENQLALAAVFINSNIQKYLKSLGILENE